MNSRDSIGFETACTLVLEGSRAIRHDILDFCERELVTLHGGGIEKEMAIIVLVKPRRNHHNISDF